MFKLHHIQLAINVITGVEIKKDQIINTMMGTECPVSLAFEGDKVVVVNNGKVVFYTTSKEYSDDVQKFLDITRALRNMRKDLKGMEKQAKEYSSPDTNSAKERQIAVMISMKTVPTTVDLSMVKQGDQIHMRSGKVLTLASVEKSRDPYAEYPYSLLFAGKTHANCFDARGNFVKHVLHGFDIIKITSIV